jgi:hypothetical protein
MAFALVPRIIAIQSVHERLICFPIFMTSFPDDHHNRGLIPKQLDDGIADTLVE